MQQFYPAFFAFHIVFSIIFFSVAIFISIYSYRGWVKQRKYARFENVLRKTFLVFLIIDLFLGVILYFFLKKPYDTITAQEAMRYSSLRFWAIQHFSNMIFVVIISMIGNIFIIKTKLPAKKHKYAFFYFGISTLIILVSVGIFALGK
ncbi:MAG: hypothetical protein C0599_11225 [Salinivirgaceae bacterium]|nr:MAG: hypothetical protein C0599_11225 [Salinivirgaceae bacterium]